MKDDGSSTLRKFSVFATGVSLLLALAALFPPEKPALLPPGFSVHLQIETASTRKSSMELRSPGPNAVSFVPGRYLSGKPFVYLWMTLRNADSRDRDLVFRNLSEVYYCELLQPRSTGAVTLYRQGDGVSVSSTPMRYYRTAFPLNVKARSTAVYVVEYHGPREVVVDPELLLPTEWFFRAASDQALLGFVCGAILLLLLANALVTFAVDRKTALAVGFFGVAAFLSFLKQSRILLLLIDPLTYPSWLYPVSIASIIVGASAVAYRSVVPYLPRGVRRLFAAITAVAVSAGVASIFAVPFAIADGLNFLSLCVLTLILAGAYRAFRAKDSDSAALVVAFLPWIVMMIESAVGSVFDVGLVPREVYGQAVGLMAALAFSTVVSLHRLRRLSREKALAARETTDRARDEANKRLLALTELRSNILLRTDHRVRRPLDTIAATIRIMERESADPRILALCNCVDDDVSEIRSELGLRKRAMANSRASPIRASIEPANRDIGRRARVHVFDGDPRNAGSSTLILRSAGYKVTAHTDRYAILSDALEGRMEALIVDPGADGESALRLCAMIRERLNVLQFPILLIVDFDADYLMSKGYAAGVNDFLTRPFDATELLARVRSLLRLREVVRHNEALMRSETEKETFLFFLTHNVNTPLTLLLNHIRELESVTDLVELPDIVDALEESGREIADIVRNVLISFRLSDGRQTAMTQSLDLASLLPAICNDLSKKVRAKGQHLRLNIPDDLPPVEADATALRGIVYNLLDNAVKFSPRGGTVELLVEGDGPVRILVRDSGPGVPAEDQGRLFGRFERLSPKPTGGESSTGLGLYVARELARLIGGDLAYVGEFSGAGFVLTVPVVVKREGLRA